MKLIVFATLVVAALAEQPYAGFNLPLFSPRIVGGVEANKGAFPYIVSLQWGPSTYSLQHFCGGSLVSSQWVLTAGHCILAVPSYGIFLVKAGKHNIRITESDEQTAEVAKSFIHEDYVGGVAPYDIALIKLKTPFKFTKTVSAISLPSAGSIPSGKVVLSGWGSVSQSSISQMPDTLQTVQLPVVDINTCRNALESIIGQTPLHETNVCTGPLTGGVSACSGDSGGPLAVTNSKSNPVVIGVVSWGIIPCGTRGAPSVYTRVSAYNDWITKIIAAN
ncbi:hypothetical protein KPH14_010468 [Odynerus spinipes]|uniref:Chymotrypsin-2 n=1 Tax=Odynerus spinipes TaxID=1348599 RepID=A0AAD9RVB9_9HYME|nr:hypothetical protein KPH14_010468 [Odynerus spinipes]